MCYAIPGRVVGLDKGFALIDYFGETKKARNDFFELKVGEFVYAQGGFVIQKVSEREAAESAEAWKELFFELKKIDDHLSKNAVNTAGARSDVIKILNGAQNGKIISKEDALALLNLESAADRELLYRTANAVRQKILSNACCIHGIIEFSSFCCCDCLYCGIRSSNRGLSRYRMTPDEIIESVREASELGFKALVLQSGEDAYYSTEIMEGIIGRIRKDFPVLIFLSVGERGRDFYKKMFDAGARGILLRFETSNRDLSAKMRPGADFQNRLEHLRFLEGMGYLIATGGLIGLPGSSKEDLVEDIFLARSFKTEMYSFGPLIPHVSTPLKDASLSSRDDILKFIAVSRLIMPDGKILVTTALETLDKDLREKALLSGANSFMLNVTPLKYRKLYDIYSNRAHADEPLKKQVADALVLLKKIGRAPTDLGL